MFKYDLNPFTPRASCGIVTLILTTNVAVASNPSVLSNLSAASWHCSCACIRNVRANDSKYIMSASAYCFICNDKLASAADVWVCVPLSIVICIECCGKMRSMHSCKSIVYDYNVCIPQPNVHLARWLKDNKRSRTFVFELEFKKLYFT